MAQSTYKCKRAHHCSDDDSGKRPPSDDCLDSYDGTSSGTRRGPAEQREGLLVIFLGSGTWLDFKNPATSLQFFIVVSYNER